MGFDVENLLVRVLRCQILEPAVIRVLCDKLKETLIQQPNVRLVQAPVTCVGDLHGQFFDLLEAFKVGGELPYSSYLFLGDYVDRGAHSVQVITLLCLLKLKYPKHVTMIRGNHQTRAVTQNYGFYMECQNKYSNTLVWKYFTDLFDFLPIAALVDNRVFAVHGGLSPAVSSIGQISGLNRFQQIPHSGALCDLMWSDPEEAEAGFIVSPRGAGYIFGGEVLRKFLHFNDIDHLTRAHQLCHDGYQLLFEGRLSTVWSAPNYMYRTGNMASVMEIGEHFEIDFNVFSQSPENVARGIAGSMDSKAPKLQYDKYFM